MFAPENRSNNWVAPRHALKYCVSLLFLYISCLVGMMSNTVEGKPLTDTATSHEISPKKKEGQKLTLNLKLHGSPEDARLDVTLKNEGDTIVVVDRKLVFLFRIECFTPKGERIDLEHVRTLKAPARNAKEWEKRLLLLKPGDTVVRKIQLQKGFTVYWAMISTHHQIACGESLERIPRTKPVHGIRVSYGRFTGYPEGLAFKHYTGLSSNRLTRLSVPIKASIAFPSVKSRSPDRDPAH